MAVPHANRWQDFAVGGALDVSHQICKFQHSGEAQHPAVSTFGLKTAVFVYEKEIDDVVTAFRRLRVLFQVLLGLLKDFLPLWRQMGAALIEEWRRA